MTVSDFSVVRGGGQVRLEARIEWEDCEREPFTLFFATSEEFENDLFPHSSILLNACLLPAWRSREKRISIAAPLCPVLVRQIEIALTTLREWYPGLGPHPRIDKQSGLEAIAPVGDGALSLMSCGIDSVALLRWNKLNLPAGHPDAISGLVMMLLTDDPQAPPPKLETLQPARQASANRVALETGTTLKVVASNIWWLVDNGHFYDKVWFGAVLASIAHVMAGGHRLGYVAAGRGISDLYPCGSHPLVDPYYSSAHFKMVLDGVEQDRLGKTALIANWKTGLDNLRVCQNDHEGVANCGTCEKCIRTKLALVALGKLGDCDAFEDPDVDVDLVKTLGQYKMISSRYVAQCYRELLPHLLARKRDDLEAALRKMVDTARVPDPYDSSTIGLEN